VVGLMDYHLVIFQWRANSMAVVSSLMKRPKDWLAVAFMSSLWSTDL
jgi:hypothetical protein